MINTVNMNIYILREIAKHDRKVWRLFSMLNKEFNKYFNVKGIEYELCFRIIIEENGDVYYKLDGKKHRTDGPAIIHSDGDEYWYFNDELHRTDGPAVTEKKNGIICWFNHGKYHRANVNSIHVCDGPAVIYQDGDMSWYKNDKRHRTDGPAMYKDGNKYWYVEGKLHRTDGPAIIRKNGTEVWCECNS